MPLVKAMERLPEYRLVIGSHLLDDISLPPNVTTGQVPRSEFIRLMRLSKAVVVPIAKGLIRSTGHQTYLNGMLLGKPTIVNDVLGVREHTQNGRNAIIVDGTPEGYREAVRKVMDPANVEQMEALGKAAQASVKRDFTFEKHCERMLEILDEAIEDCCKGVS
jgi:glycosyltransferase involved in cell wall biosynthesis